VLKSVIIGMKGVLECYRILRGFVEVLSLWRLMMSKYVSDEDASCPWDVFKSQGVSLRCP
jgi:hypothetical protein